MGVPRDIDEDLTLGLLMDWTFENFIPGITNLIRHTPAVLH